ncbi:metal-dependent hydrolase [Candidatus Woesearchaeota archaeon]|nr:metal-dependent hydrolase [Candidatus Woesearchaeota archaeon]
MAYAVTHILVPLIVLSILQHYFFGVKKFPSWVVLIGGLAGLAPDADIVLSWIVEGITGSQVDFHGSFSHSFIWPLVFAVLGLVFYYLKKQRWMQVACVVSFGWLSHILIDIFFKPAELKAWAWPFGMHVVTTGGWDLYPHAPDIDAILLVLWLLHEQFKHKIREWF